MFRWEPEGRYEWYAPEKISLCIYDDDGLSLIILEMDVALFFCGFYI